MHDLVRLLSASALTLSMFGCAGPKPTPAEATGHAPAADPDPADAAITIDICSSDYTVEAVIVSSPKPALEEMIDGTVITDRAPFSCQLRNGDASVAFAFEQSVTGDSCPYSLSYVNDVSGEEFSGTQTLNCANAEIDFTATATPDSKSPACAGKTTLVDDPKIVLNTDNCGTGLE